MQISTKQFMLTVAAGKRLIAKAVAAGEPVKKALDGHTIVVTSGSTNGYVAEELLTLIGQKGDFSKNSFLRGVNVGPGGKVEKGPFNATDVVIENGKWQREKTIFDAAPGLKNGDVIIKGANALNAERTLAGIQIGNPTFGTSEPILEAVLGRRAQLIIPIGLEKRIFGDLAAIAARLNAPSASGVRLLPVAGTIVTELEAVALLTGAAAELVAAGGILGAEGSCWIAVSGTDDELQAASVILDSVANEPAFGK